MAPSFQRKQAVAVVLASICFLVLLALGVDSVGRLREEADAAHLARGLHLRLQTVLLTTLDLESRQRAYLLTTAGADLEAYQAASARLDGELGQLAALLAIHPEQVPQHARLVSLVEQRRVILARQIELAKEQGSNAVLATLPIGSGAPLLDDIREVIARMQDEEAAGLDASQAKADASLRRATWLGGAMAALTALLLVASYRLMRSERALQAQALRNEVAAKEAAQQQAVAEARLAARTAAALDDSEARLRGVFESASEAILVTDDAQDIVMANPAAARIFRCPLDQLIGAPLGRFVPERFRHRLRSDIAAFVRGDAGVRPDVWGLRADGEEFPVDASISDMKIEDRNQHMVILRDVTDLRRAQDELARSHDELRRLVAAQEDVRENERKRIAREIHDELQQTLAAIKIDLGTIAGRVRSDPGAALAMLGEADRLAADAVASTRRIVNDLRPRLLDDLGLVPALEVLLEQFAQRFGIKCRLEASDGEGSEPRAPAPVSTCLYRVTQEALQNVAKHAGARQVDVWLSEPRPGWLKLRIADDGSGIAENDLRKPQSYGLIGMRERVRALGGRVEVRSPPEGGTAIELELPASENLATD